MKFTTMPYWSNNPWIAIDSWTESVDFQPSCSITTFVGSINGDTPRSHPFQWDYHGLSIINHPVFGVPP